MLFKLVLLGGSFVAVGILASIAALLFRGVRALNITEAKSYLFRAYPDLAGNVELVRHFFAKDNRAVILQFRPENNFALVIQHGDKLAARLFKPCDVKLTQSSSGLIFCFDDFTFASYDFKIDISEGKALQHILTTPNIAA